ncbi:MAG: phosphoribosylamine--glycine ligase [Dactylosporangium sp.]|nr:phosphoribosylamine--glycine ligase [Dactylosporangium sp.]NNJ60864.1 phosphoribosylamine--glycine ligase [Dactylosporangium sp.]
MRVLLLGSGGREHALAVSLVADPTVTELVGVPGNPGIASLDETGTTTVRMLPGDITDPDTVAAIATEISADLVVVGPELPLVAGVADALRAKGLACFGPSRAAAALEGSKAFAKDVMAAAGVPTAGARLCASPAELTSALEEFGAPYVVKNDGLAAGKGVLVTSDRDAALAHGAACGRVLVEEYLAGPEVSLFVVTDGVCAVPLMPAQDFKRVGDGDTGGNTGGMGAYAPLPWAPATLVNDVMAGVVRPTLAEMDRRGTPFAGLLYVGLVLTAQGPKVIEFNCRFGDPETQVVLALLRSPLAGLLHAAATGRLAEHPPLDWHRGAAVTVVLAAAGYPGTPRRGDPITGADGVPGVLHAGTARGTADVPTGAAGAGRAPLVSAGGRVLCATAVDTTLAGARDAAYRLIDGIHLDGAHYRRDIADAAIRGAIST